MIGEIAIGMPVKRAAQTLTEIQQDGFRIWSFKAEADVYPKRVDVNVSQFVQGKIRISAVVDECQVSCFLSQKVWNEAVEQKVAKDLFVNFDEAVKAVQLLQLEGNDRAASLFYFYWKSAQDDKVNGIPDEVLLARLQRVDELKKLFPKPKSHEKKRKNADTETQNDKQ